MKKLFSFIVAIAAAVVGVLFIVAGIKAFCNGAASAGWESTTIYIIYIVGGVITVLTLFKTISAIFKKHNSNVASQWALFSLGILVITSTISNLIYWISLKSAVGVDQNYLTSLMISWIIGVGSGALLVLAALPVFPVGLRRLFGVLGTIVGVAMFAILCTGLNSSVSALVWVVIIGGAVVSGLGLLLSCFLNDKKD